LAAARAVLLSRRMKILLLFAAGCTVAGPVIEPIEDQEVAVGDELRLEVWTAGDVSYHSGSGDPGARASLTPRDGGALFRFRPVADDVGPWVFDFRADGDRGASVETVHVDVRPALGAAPVFRRPVGAGTEVSGDCIELDVAITDQDSAAVAIRQVEPLIAGAELVPGGALAATWRWCPDADQRAAGRTLLTLAADDGDHPPVLLRYQLVMTGCRDDPFEEDDGPATERWIDLDLATVRMTGNQICSGDDDWSGFALHAGETVEVHASFDAPTAAGDLDLVVQGEDGTPVAVAQEAGSNEHMSVTSEAGGVYHLVVHGWQGASNAYDLCASLDPAACP
jgi:hypothetical protein